MWTVDDPTRYARALKASHVVSSRVELFSEGRPVDEVPFEEGTVTDTWVTAGIRRTLDLTVEPTRSWLRWLDLPLLEARPWRGIRFSRSATVECPLGRFPIVTPDMSRPVSTIKIGAEDYYQRIVQANFSYPVQTETKPAVQAILDLITGPIYPVYAPFAPVRPNVTTASTATAPGVLLDRTRHDALVGYAKSFGLEIFFDRLGVPTVADVQSLSAAQTRVLVGETAEALAVKSDWAKVYNQVAVISSAQGVDFPAQVAVITDPKHPAAQWRIGARVLKYSSPLLMDQAAGMAAARTILTKVSAAARTFTYTCVPDTRRDAGDSILGGTIDGAEVAQILSVSHPLRASGRQSITTVSTQQEYT